MRYEDVKSIGGKTRFVFNSPPWYMGALAVAIVSSIFGIMVWGISLEGVLNGFLLLGIPAYASALLCLGYARLVNSTYWARTDLLISFASIAFSMMIYGISLLAHHFFVFDLRYALVISLTVPFWIRHTYMSSITITGQLKAFPMSVSYAAMIFISMLFVFNSDGSVLLFFLASSASAFLFSAIFLASVDAPMRHVLGVGGLEFTMWTVKHYKEKSRKGHDNLEAIFDRFGEEGIVHFSTLSFERSGKVESALLVHTAHPGPVGDVGGGDMPAKLSRITGIERLITPHGASTHDMNPTTEKEVEKLGRAVRKSLKGGEVGVSKAIRERFGEVSVLAQRFGDVLMVVETSSPKGTEDIDPAVAVALNERVRHMGYDGLMLVDAHNCFDSDAIETRIQSPKFLEIEGAVTEAAKELASAELYEARIGYGEERSLGMEEGVASMGVQALVVEAGGQRTAYINIDGNNMVPGLRERIMDALKGMAENMEVMTTDNHYVNWTEGGKNPVGYFGGHDRIIEACRKALKDALEEMRPAKVMVNRGSVKIRVFGPNRSAYMYCVPRSIDGFGKYAVVMSMGAMLLADVLLAMLI